MAQKQATPVRINAGGPVIMCRFSAHMCLRGKLFREVYWQLHYHVNEIGKEK